MSSIPTIQIRQQYAAIEIEQDPGRLNMHSSPADFQMSTSQAQLHMESTHGVLQIDQSEAWDAFATGSTIRLNQRIYSQCQQIALRAIAKTMENAHRLGAIQNGGNPIADIAAERAFADVGVEIPSSPSYDSVRFDYSPTQLNMNVTPGEVRVDARPIPVDIQVEPAKVEIYIRQKQQLDITPPQIDLQR